MGDDGKQLSEAATACLEQISGHGGCSRWLQSTVLGVTRTVIVVECSILSACVEPTSQDSALKSDVNRKALAALAE